MTYTEKVNYLEKNYKGHEFEGNQIRKILTPKQLEKALNEKVLEKYDIRKADLTTGWNWVRVTIYKVKE